MSDFVAGEGHRWYTDSRKCPHYNENVCAGCDFDRYYATNYKTVPWRVERPDDDPAPVPTCDGRNCGGVAHE